MTDNPDTGPIIVAEFRKNAREVVRVSLDNFKGTQCVSVRLFFEAASGEMRPGRSGISMAIRHLPNLAGALADVLAKAQASGLIAAAKGDD